MERLQLAGSLLTEQEWINALVAAAPPLTPEQSDTLKDLINGDTIATSRIKRQPAKRRAVQPGRAEAWAS